MQESKKQHYVPQVYLRAFSVEDKVPEKLFVKQKEKTNVFSAGVKDIACQRHFYTIKKEENPYVWENFYATEIEPDMGNTCKEIMRCCAPAILQDKAAVLSAATQQKLLEMMMVQLLRGVQSRVLQRKTYNENVHSVILEMETPLKDLPQEYSVVLQEFIENEEYLKEISMKGVLDPMRLEKYMRILRDKIVVVCKITGEREWVTSDNPVMLMNLKTTGVVPFANGIKDASTAIYFPVSPKILIAVYSPITYNGALSDLNGKVLLLDEQKEESFIKKINQKQWEQCYRQVYAKRKESLLEIK